MNRKYLQLAIGFFALLFLGVAYAWSLFAAPLKETFGWSSEMLSLIFTISMICFCLGGIAGSIIRIVLSHRIVLTGLAISLCMGFVVSANTQAIWHIYLAYGIICGFSIGIAYNVIITTVNLWFKDKIGFSSGILTMGFGIGGFLLGFLISKSNHAFGWRTTFYLLAAIFLMVLLTEAYLLRLPDDPKIETPIEYSVFDLSPLKMLKTKLFAYFFIWGVIVSATGLAIIGHASQISSVDWNTLFSPVIATGLVSVSNGFSRIMYGRSYDKIGRDRTMQLVTLSLVTGILLLFVSINIMNSILMMMSFVFIGSSYGGLPPSNSAFVREYFGKTHYGTNFSIATAGGVPAAFIGPYIMGSSVDRNGNYLSALLFLMGLGAVVVIFLILLKVNDPIKQEKRLGLESRPMDI